MERRLRVAYVGNFRRPWCTEVHVMRSLQALGHEVVPLQEDQVNWRTLPQVIRQRDCQVMLWTRTWVVDNEAADAALDVLATQGVPTASFHLDRWFGLDREHQVWEYPFFRTNIVFSPDGGSDDLWKGAGVNHYWLPPGVFAGECGTVQPDPRLYPHDVVFVGSHPYPHAEWQPYRTELIERLSARFGDRFHVWPDSRGPIRGRALQALYASAKVVVGDSCLVGTPSRYWSDRIPETLGRGGFLIHPEVDGMEDWYKDSLDLMTYPVGNFDAVIEIAEMALDDDEERGAVAARGRATVLGRDTYEHRMTTVLDEIDKQVGIPERKTARRARPSDRAPRTPPQPQVGRLVRHVATRQRAVIEAPPGSTDDHAIDEVWANDSYRVGPRTLRAAVVVDIGANVGAFSILAAKAGAQHVYAFEPGRVAGNMLRGNVDRNGVDTKVSVNHTAVTADGRMVDLLGEGSGSFLGDGSGDTESMSINDVLSNVLAVTTEIGFMKLDCEGSEYEIIEAIDPALLVRVKEIAMEFHGPVMPHLSHLRVEQFGPMVTKLASYGRTTIEGRPQTGGLLWWARY